MARTTKHTPTRTCIGCRKTTDSDTLERFVLMDDQIIYDMRQKAPGRGAYLHLQCADMALKKNAFSRAFKQRVNQPSAEVLKGWLSDGIMRRIKERISICARAQAVTIGQNQSAQEMAKNKVRLLLIASDAGESTVKKFRANAQRKKLLVFQWLSAQELGSLCGKTHVSVLGITHSTLYLQIANDFENLGQLGVFDS